MNNIIFLLGNTNTYNNLVYNTLNDCIDASTIFKNEINWKIIKNLYIINHSSSNQNNYSNSPYFNNYYISEYMNGYRSGQTDYLKEAKRASINTAYFSGDFSCMYRPCINVHE